MSATFINPIHAALDIAIAPEFTFGETIISRIGQSFEVRHLSDRSRLITELRKLNSPELLDWFQFDTNGVFRPLRTAPTMKRGWTCIVMTAAALLETLDCIYPGAAADWFSATNGTGKPTHFHEFTSRQSGMYRVTAKLTDEQAADVTRHCCASKRCLRQRRWTAGNLPTDLVESKSCIPCWEPCALHLESTRIAFRRLKEQAC